MEEISGFLQQKKFNLRAKNIQVNGKLRQIYWKNV